MGLCAPQLFGRLFELADRLEHLADEALRMPSPQLRVECSLVREALALPDVHPLRLARAQYEDIDVSVVVADWQRLHELWRHRVDESVGELVLAVLVQREDVLEAQPVVLQQLEREHAASHAVHVLELELAAELAKLRLSRRADLDASEHDSLQQRADRLAVPRVGCTFEVLVVSGRRQPRLLQCLLPHARLEILFEVGVLLEHLSVEGERRELDLQSIALEVAQLHRASEQAESQLYFDAIEREAHLLPVAVRGLDQAERVDDFSLQFVEVGAISLRRRQEQLRTRAALQLHRSTEVNHGRAVGAAAEADL